MIGMEYPTSFNDPSPTKLILLVGDWRTEDAQFSRRNKHSTDLNKIITQMEQQSKVKSVSRVTAGAARFGFTSDFQLGIWEAQLVRLVNDISLFLPSSAVAPIFHQVDYQECGSISTFIQRPFLERHNYESWAKPFLPVESNLQCSIWIYLAELATFTALGSRV